MLAIAGGHVDFVAMRYAGDIDKVASWLPFALGAGIMTFTTICAWWIKEAREPATRLPAKP